VIKGILSCFCLKRGNSVTQIQKMDKQNMIVAFHSVFCLSGRKSTVYG